MRIALITEGTYPCAHGGVSVWCDQLLRGLDEHEFAVTAIVATGAEPAVWDLPANVRVLTRVPLWGVPVARRPRRRDLARFHSTFDALLDATFRPGPDSIDTVRAALTGLRSLARDDRLTAAMRSARVVQALLANWRSCPLPGHTATGVDVIPPATVGDAVRAATLLEHALRPLGVAPPAAQVCHAVSNGLATLPALAAKWERGTPFLLTEHGIYLRERYLEFRGNGTSFAVRALMMRFYQLLTSLAYRDADLISPASDYNRRWQIRQGAPDGRIACVHNGIDPAQFAAADEPDAPTLSWLGRITPIKDLHTLIRAFRTVVDDIPQARLRIFGSAPPGDAGYLHECLDLVRTLGLSDQVSFDGRVEEPAQAHHAGSLAVMSSTSEGFPYTVLEAMACGRATVSTDVGGVREAVADTGLVVPPRDPQALAQACITLLRDAARRARMAAAARQRVHARFTVQQCLDQYRQLYLDLADGARPHDRGPRASGSQDGGRHAIAAHGPGTHATDTDDVAQRERDTGAAGDRAPARGALRPIQVSR